MEYAGFRLLYSYKLNVVGLNEWYSTVYHMNTQMMRGSFHKKCLNRKKNG